MVTQAQDGFQDHDAPTVPHVEWRVAIVRYTQGSCCNIRLFPDETRGQVLAQIYRGDMIQVCLTFKKDNWRICRCGHITGWLDTSTVKLLMRETQHESTNEEPTQPVKPVAAQPESHARQSASASAERRSLVQRLIGFFSKS